jgi:fatty-acyl-CoA synthase
VLLGEFGTITWAEFAHSCGSVAAGLRRCGVAHGDRVGALARNIAEYLELFFACARIGAVFVPLNPRLTGPELRQLSEHAGISMLLTDSSFTDALDCFDDVVAPERIYFAGKPPEGGRAFADLIGADRVSDAGDVFADDPMCICYTSGTTGAPKGAVLTHGNIEAIAASVLCCDGLNYRDRAAIPVPLAFTGAGISVAMPIMYVGGSIYLEQSLVPSRMLDLVEHHGVTTLGLVPFVYQQMAAEPDFDRRDLGGLKAAKVGGAPVPRPVLETYQAHGVALVGAFGITEGGGFNMQLPAADALRKLGTVGLPAMHQRCRVADPEGRTLPVGEAGELLIAGSTVMKEYWRDPVATQRALKSGWLHTGDVARVYEEGYFTVVDRIKDMLISGGINVYPAEVESAIAAHPDVMEAAVVGVPHEKWGDTPLAFVVSRDPQLCVEALREFLADKLADYKRPTQLRLVDSLPRSMSGKLLKTRLRELASNTNQ